MILTCKSEVGLYTRGGCCWSVISICWPAHTFLTQPLQFPDQPYVISGSIIVFIEKLDEEFTKILQATDAHSTEYVNKLVNDMYLLSSLVPRPPRPAFVACSTKSGGRPGRTYHVMRAAADVMFSPLTSGFVLSPSLFFPWIQFVLSVQFVLRVRLLLDRSWLATVCDVSSGTHHVINPSRPFPHFSNCKRQKPGVDAWEWSC